jgi:hypothetical protein
VTSATSSADFQIEFQLPSDFREIHPTTSREEAESAVQERLGGTTLSGDASDEAARQYLAASQVLARTGVLYAATYLGLLDGRPSLSAVVLATMEADCRDPDVVVEGIVQVRGGTRDAVRREAKRFDLPCGPAALVISGTDGVVISGEALGAAHKDLPVPFATLQAYVPVPRNADPGQRTLTVITFSTPSLQDWATYCPVMVEMLRSLTFTSPAESDKTGARSFAEPVPSPTSTIRRVLG